MDALILSYALDTNGQNARYVRASEKHGEDKAVLSALAIGRTDPGGVLGRFQMAAEKLGSLHIRSVHRAEQYFQFPHDIAWTRQAIPQIKKLAEQADVIHLNNSWRPAQNLGVHRKPMLLHHHGSLFRRDPAYMLREARSRRMIQAVSTMDLRQPAPDILHWLPTAYDLDWLEAYAAERRSPSDRIRIVSAPTNREYKATDALIAAVADLQAEGLPVDLTLVEGVPWAQCLEAKAQADILFDQTAYGYGCNAVEAWGMGIPVVSGGDPWTLDRMRQEWGGLPFYETTQDTIADALRAMVLSADLRAEWAARGMAHARKYHDELPALTRLAELYELTIRAWNFRAYTKAEEAVRFRNNGHRNVFVNGQRVTWEQGVYETDDPTAIEQLRRFSARRNFGIVEEKTA